jgi:hypothetical protein
MERENLEPFASKRTARLLEWLLGHPLIAIGMAAGVPQLTQDLIAIF